MMLTNHFKVCQKHEEYDTAKEKEDKEKALWLRNL